VFKLWGIPFVSVGLYLTIGRFFVDARARARTYYAITNERALVISGVSARRVKSLPLRTLGDITLSERAGSGTITLGPVPPWGLWYGGFQWPGMSARQPSAFEMIGNARSVHDILQRARREAPPG
jgi:hypothetical protein